MCVRPENSLAVLLEREVVNEAKEGLEKKEDEQSKTDDRVGIMHHPHVCRHVDADSGSGDIDDIGDHLENAVNQPQSAEVAKTDHDASRWEEETEGHCGANGMGSDHLVDPEK